MENFYLNSEYLHLSQTENKGRQVTAKKDIPECTTLIHEKPLYYFDSSIHPPSILTCEICLKFYNNLSPDQIRENQNIQIQIAEFEKWQNEKEQLQIQKKAEKLEKLENQEKLEKSEKQPKNENEDEDLSADYFCVSDSSEFSSDDEKLDSDNQQQSLQGNSDLQNSDQNVKQKKQKFNKYSQKPKLIYSDAVKELQTTFQGHLGYIHLMAEILLSKEENLKKQENTKNAKNTDLPSNNNNMNQNNQQNQNNVSNFQEFQLLDFCPSKCEKNENLQLTKDFLIKFFESQNDSWDLEKQEIFEKLISNSHGQTEPPENGLFIRTSMINHSCKNNCFYFLENQEIHVRNFRKILKGEELTVSYIRNLYQPRILRQKELAYRGFKCQCLRCENKELEEVRVWNCPKNKSDNCSGLFMPVNNSASFKCEKCGHSENYLNQAKKSEKNIDMDLLHKRHFKIHQDMDNNLNAAGFSMPPELFETLSLQLINNYKQLFQTNYYPENISLYDVIAQRFNKEKNKQKTQFYFEKAYQEAVACFGQNSQQAQLQLSRMKNPPQQCSIF